MATTLTNLDVLVIPNGRKNVRLGINGNHSYLSFYYLFMLSCQLPFP